MQEMSEKGYQIEYTQERFNQLSTNPQTDKIDEKFIFEGKGGLKEEDEGLYTNLHRPDNKDIDLDFQVDSPEGFTFLDHKGMVDFKNLAKKRKDISHFPSHKTVAYNMGRDIPDPKERFVGLPKGPESLDNVLHLVNFNKIRDPPEKRGLVSAVINRAEDASGGPNIRFINYE